MHIDSQTLPNRSKQGISRSTDWMDVIELDQKRERRTDLANAIAVRLLGYRRAEKLTNQALAERVGVSAQYMGRVLKGRENLSLDTIAKLETATGLVLMEVPKKNMIARRVPRVQACAKVVKLPLVKRDYDTTTGDELAVASTA